MGRVGTVVPMAAAPSEALRLLGESEAALDPAGPLTPWLVAQDVRFREQIRDGGVEGGLWIGPKDEAVGLALWSPDAGTGRNVVIALGDGFRSAATLAAFVRALDADGPLRSVNGPVPGVPDMDVDAALGREGFTAVVRGDMLFPDTTPTPPASEDPAFPIRSLDRTDAEAVARLIERTYAETIDRWLFARTLNEDFGDAAAAEVLGVGVGTWRPDASFGIEAAGRLVAATLVNELDGPLLTEVMVDPAWRRRGFARRLIARSIAAVRSLRLGTLRLVVRIGNEAAEPLYGSVGFVASPVRGSVWLRVPRRATGAGQGSSD